MKQTVIARVELPVSLVGAKYESIGVKAIIIQEGSTRLTLEAKKFVPFSLYVNVATESARPFSPKADPSAGINSTKLNSWSNTS